MDESWTRTAIAIALVMSVALFVAMIAAQSILKLDAFKLGADFKYTAETLRDNVSNSQGKAMLAVFPILYPLDLLFLATAGALFGLCSIFYGGQVGLSLHWTWLLLFPALYVVADFSENLVFAGMLMNAHAITKGSVALAHSLTAIKWFAVVVSIAQSAGLFIWSSLARH